MVAVGEKDGHAVFSIRAQPRSSRSALAGMYGTALKISLKAAPVDDAANKECCRFLGKLFQLPASQVHILSGKTSRTKLVMLQGVRAEDAQALIEDLVGKS